MEIQITKLFNSICPSDFSASPAEIGNNAGQDTWNAAKEESEEWENEVLTTEEQKTAFIDYMTGMGFSEGDEMQDWPQSELVALFIQLVSGDIREGNMGRDFGLDTGAFDWAEYEELAEAGQCSSNMFKGDDNEIYYYLGC